MGAVHADHHSVRDIPLPPDAVAQTMEPLLCFPDPPPVALQKAIESAGYPFVAVASTDDATRHEPEDGWVGAVVSAAENPEAAFELCRVLRKRESPVSPLLLVIEQS